MVRSLYACKHHTTSSEMGVGTFTYCHFPRAKRKRFSTGFEKRFVKLLYTLFPLLLMVHLHTANGNIISRQKPLFHFGKITGGRTSEGDDGKSRKALGKPLGRLIHKSELQDQHLAAASLLIQLLTIHVVTWRWTEKWMLHLPFVQLWYAYYVVMMPFAIWSYCKRRRRRRLTGFLDIFDGGRSRRVHLSTAQKFWCKAMADAEMLFYEIAIALGVV